MPATTAGEETSAELWTAVRRLEAAREATAGGWALLTFWSVFMAISVPTLSLRWGALGVAASSGIVAVCGGIVLRLWSANRERHDLEAYFCDHHHIDAIGPLAEAVATTHGRHGEAVRYALTRLVRQVTPDRFPTLTFEQRKALRAALLYDPDFEMGVAILRAYKVIGDRYEREVVRMMAEGIQTETRASQLQTAARDCLRAMDPTYTGPGQGELLRPVYNRDETLVRPAGASAEDEALLLRPQTHEESGE
jgi:hypothetical protein